VTGELRRRHVTALRAALGTGTGYGLDVVVSGPGGNLEAAYLVSRELRRRFEQVTIYVPLLAKSAATLICLAGNELVLGPLGELGPLDAQGDEKQLADFPVTVSRLGPFKALEQLDHAVLGLYDALVSRVVDKGGMRLFDACSKAAELTSSIYTAIYAQIDPHRIAESARGLEIGAGYAERILRRYRSEVFARSGRELIDRLVHAYPSHGFILDLEELTDLGLPVRAPDATEGPAVDALAMALIDLDDATELIEVAESGVSSPAGTGCPGENAMVSRPQHGTGDQVSRAAASPADHSATSPGSRLGCRGLRVDATGIDTGRWRR
jgi:hypothetical protein